MMTAVLLLSSCTVAIKDETFCAVVPGNNGAVCDNFLTSDQKILNEADWGILQMQWESQGQALECTTSSAVANLKRELEQLCSKTACDYPSSGPAEMEDRHPDVVSSADDRAVIRKMLEVLNRVDQAGGAAKSIGKGDNGLL